jgi:predicted ATPase
VLKKLRVRNFRLLRDVEIEFERDAPTVFVGPNGSGKSTVLEVLDFLSRCATDGVQAAAAAHGGLSSIRTIGSNDAVSLETIWWFRTWTEGREEQKQQWKLRWSVSMTPAMDGGPVVQREELVDEESNQPRLLVMTDDKGVRQVLAEDASDARPNAVRSSGELAFGAFVDQKRYEGLYNIRDLLSTTKVIGALFTAPNWARSETSQPSPRDSLVIGPKQFLDRQGLGLANVLFTLFNNHAEAWQELEKNFRAEFPFVRRVVFPPDVGGSKIAFAIEDARFPGRKLFASEMSDGMIAYLCLLASVLHPGQQGVLGLDEPDANLHPSALRRFIALSHREHDGRSLAIVTHSNALLDELRDPAQSIRVVEPTKTGARIRKLDAEALAAWRKDYALSELRRTGLLDPTNASYGADD